MKEFIGPPTREEHEEVSAEITNQAADVIIAGDPVDPDRLAELNDDDLALIEVMITLTRLPANLASAPDHLRSKTWDEE